MTAESPVDTGEIPVVGVPEPFESFYRREVGPLLAVLISLSRNRVVAEEVAQEAFLTAYREWERVGRLNRPDLWIRRVACNMAISRFRRLQAEWRALTKLQDRSTPPAAIATADEALWREVRQLPARQAQIVALTYVDDLTSDQVGEVLGIDPATVRKHLTRARRTLADRLGESYEP